MTNMKKVLSLLIITILTFVGSVLANSKEDVYRAAVAAISSDPKYKSHKQLLNAFKAELDIYEATPLADMAFTESMKNVFKYLSQEYIEYILGASSPPKQMKEHFDKSIEAGKAAKIHLEIAKRRLSQ